MKKTFLITLALIIIAGGFALLNKKQPTKIANNTLRVTTSFYPLYFFASEIGGDKATIKNITPAGAEPHDYEPTAQDIAQIEKNNLLILNGGVESWGNKIKENLKNKNVTLVVAGDGLLNQQLEEEGKIIQDPHIWLDPQLAKKEVANIAEGYKKVDPANASYYTNNQTILNNKLDQLDKAYVQGLKTCKQKDIITSHAAFGYLASRYKLNQVAISGVSPDEEPSSQQIAEVAKFAKENNVTYIFFESLVSPKLAETIAHEVGAKTLVLDPLEGISDDDKKQGKNYFTVMEANLKNLQEALKCNQ